MNFVQFPDITPSSMDFVAPRFPVGSDTSLGGVSSRRKFGNRQYDGRLTVEFRNISNYLCAQVLLTCINSRGLAPIAFYESFFRGAGDDLRLFLDGSAYPGLLWYFIEDSPPRINRVEGGAEVSNMSMELAARLMPDSTGSSTTPILPAPLPTPGGPGGGTVQPTQYVTSVSAEAPLSSTGGTNPVLSLPMATQTADGGMSKNDKLKLDNIEVGAQPNVPTNLAYTPSTRLLASSTGDDVTLPLVSSADPGLAPSSGGGTTNFLRADGTWAAPPQSSTDLSYTPSIRLLQSSTGNDATLPLVSSGDAGLAPASGGGTSNYLRADGTWAQPPGTGVSAGTLTHTTGSLAAGASADFTLSSNSLFQLLSLTASTPAWIRVYGTSAARAADARTNPGGTLPLAGSEYYAELVTTATPQTIRLSPVPLVQPTAGLVYLRVQNTDTVTRALALQFSILSFNS
jgi:hypothetical protein